MHYVNVHTDVPTGRSALLRFAAKKLRELPGVLLTGPAGIGKSYLLDQLVTHARAEGVRVLRCSPTEAELPLPFMCLIDLLEPVSDQAVADLPSGQRNALRAALLRGGDAAAATGGAGVHLAVLTLLRRLAEQGPVWLVVDDSQWLDEPTAQILRYVSRRTAGLRLRVLAAERLSAGRPPTQAGICPVGSAQLAVPEMSPSDLAVLLEQHYGAPVPDRALRRIARVAQGNPLYALGILRSLPGRSEPARPPSDDPLLQPADPVLLGGLLLDRLRTLSEDVRETLVLASAAARPDLTLLATAGGAAATVHLEAAERVGVVRIGTDGRIAFDHPLLRDAVYSAAPGHERRTAHARLAAAATEPVQRARHLALANPAQDEDVARTLMVAAAAARRRGAPATAAELSALAVARTPADAADTRAARRLACAEYACDAGRLDSARSEANTLLAEEENPQTRVGARIVLLKCAGQALEGEQRLITEGLTEAADSPALEARLRRWASARDLLAGRVGQAAAEARRAAELSTSAGDAPARAEALTALAYLQRLGGDPEAEATLGRALAIAAGQGSDDLWTWETLVTEGIFHLHANRLAAAEAAITAALARFGERVSVEEAMHAQVVLTDIHARSGDCAAAMRSAGLAAALYSDIDGSEGPVTYAGAIAESTGGTLERARELADRGARNAERDGDRFWFLWNMTVLGRVHLLSGEPTVAARVLRQVRQIEQSMGIVDPGVGRWHADLAEALVGAGSLDEAREFIDGASATAARLGRSGVLACLGRASALRLLALGETAEAAALLGSSVRQLRLDELPLELARTLLVLAEADRRRRRHAAARSAVDEASELCRAAGATAWLPLIEKGPHPAVRKARGAAQHSLTPTEQRIAELAASGSTNREIAAACFLSVKTVEASLSRAYRKLGVRSRTELAKTLPG